jgi:hypothetical protein
VRAMSSADELITLVHAGKMEPSEAEAKASQLGIGPLAKCANPDLLNPLQEPFWTLLMTLAWIATRDVDAVREVWMPWRDANEFWSSFDYTLPDGRKRTGFEITTAGPAYLVDFDCRAARWRLAGRWYSSCLDSEPELFTALRGAQLEAIGIPSEGGMRVAIPAHQWLDLDLYELKNRVVVRMSKAYGPGYDHVVLRFVDVSRIWTGNNSPAVGSALANRGRPPKFDWSTIMGKAEELMDYHGDFSSADDWNARARLEEHLMTFCQEEWQEQPSPTQLRHHLRPFLDAWHAKKTGRKIEN